MSTLDVIKWLVIILSILFCIDCGLTLVRLVIKAKIRREIDNWARGNSTKRNLRGK